MNILAKFGRSVLAMLLVVCMVFSMSAAAFASEMEPVDAAEETEEALIVEPEIDEEPVYTEEETESVEEEQEEQEELYVWEHPITHIVYTDLTLEDYLYLLGCWAEERASLLAEGLLPRELMSAEELAEFVVPAEDDEEPAEQTAEATEETPQTAEAAEETYYVDYKIGDKLVKVNGNDGIYVTELLAGLGVEIPEGAVIAIDPESIDAKNLTVSSVDGHLLLTTNGAFFEADRDLVVRINGVPTVIKVSDGITAAAFETLIAGDETKLTESKQIESGEISIDDSGEKVIDLNGHTIYGAKDADYAIKVDGTGASTPVIVTFMNGTIEAANNAVAVVGNAIVKFFNMTINAAKEVLHIESTTSDSAKAVVDKNSTLRTTYENKKAATRYDTIVLKGDGSELVLDGKAVNHGNGYVISKEDAADSADIYLGSHAKLKADNHHRDLDSSVKATDVYSNGASFAHGSGLRELFTLVLDKNYDTPYRVVTTDATHGLPEKPTRPGYNFVGWNTRADGTGRYVSRTYALKHGITKLYAIWTEADPYTWLVKGTIEGYNGVRYQSSSRIDIENRVASLFFQDGYGDHLVPVKVEFVDVSALMKLGVDVAKVELEDGVYLELDLKDLLEKGGKNVNTLVLERDQDDLLTVVSGETEVFCFNIAEMNKATKNDLTLSYADDTATVFYGKDEITDTKLPDGQFSMLKLDAEANALSVSKAK